MGVANIRRWRYSKESFYFSILPDVLPGNTPFAARKVSDRFNCGHSSVLKQARDGRGLTLANLENRPASGTQQRR